MFMVFDIHGKCKGVYDNYEDAREVFCGMYGDEIFELCDNGDIIKIN